jgi:hypothetical protein
MTPAPQALAPEKGPEAEPARERVAADVPADVAERLRVWAALRRMPAAHVVAELVIAGVPGDEQLKGLIGQKGAGNGHPDR